MKKDILFFILIAVLAVALIGGVKIESVEDFYATHPDAVTEDSQTVFLSIDCSTVIGNENLKEELNSEEYIGKDGKLAERVELVLLENDTAFSLLQRYTRYVGMALDYQTTVPRGFYIRGINHLYEYDCGNLSGWFFSVNGEFLSVGCGDCALVAGDSVLFVYSCNMGVDIGAGVVGT